MAILFVVKLGVVFYKKKMYSFQKQNEIKININLFLLCWRIKLCLIAESIRRVWYCSRNKTRNIKIYGKSVRDYTGWVAVL